ncbi:hypothetical protein K469DRAFT_562705 [Zopfia rhizophila CBS 207.26]|uniref:ABM domain-containing protein n=1 Tax=Zopfia rhizophila CBS 207.26 TaxID=1314779 RepID=A0A6A6EIV6_9PEZI|nr:hypothetical protein K469DRAFT_562705 [Zopfia rhizophila CBS 207.26]
MAITEIALIRLLPPTTVDDPLLQSKLAHAKYVMENFTGRRFYYMHQVEDPSLLYVIGEWDSLKQHMEQFIPSADNQALLESLKDQLTVEWLLHIDAPHSELPLPKSKTTSQDKSQYTNETGTLVYSIGRHFVKAGEKDKFKETFENKKHYLQDYATEGTIGGGWRVDKKELKEEFVLFCPWKDVEQHMSFAKTDGFEKYAKVRDFIDGAEIKHVKIIDI